MMCLCGVLVCVELYGICIGGLNVNCGSEF